jgi:hypothetical protein
MPDSLDGLAEIITAQPAPVVLLDACAVLDIVRSPIRKEISSSIVETSIALKVAASGAPPSVWLVAADLATQEVAEHLPAVEKEMASRIEELDRCLSDVATITEHLPTGSFPQTRVTPLALPAHLRGLAEALMATTRRLEVDQECRFRAGGRVAQGLAPSGKGRQQYKDCEILEHYLELARRLRSSGFAPQVVFVSSNTADYGTPPDKILAAIQVDIDSVGMSFVTSLNWAHARIAQPQANA